MSVCSLQSAKGAVRMYESQLRDLIANNLDRLEKGLVLLAKEEYIPNPLGTRGFIDIYARDERGNHVLIELKRSNAAAREAIHEIYKYVEGAKRHLGAKDDEIRVMIVSTEWKELLVPFSKFISETELNVNGLKIDLIGSAEFTATPISALSVANGRFIAPWHVMCWYLSEDSLREGICSIEKSCREKGIEDYVIVVLRFGQPISSEHEAGMRDALMQMMGGNIKSGVKLPEYKFIAYFAMQTLTKDACLHILSGDEEAYAEAQDIVLNTEDDYEALCLLHESVVALNPSFERDYYELGYPAKLEKYLENTECSVQELRRYGIFERNKLLDDAVIISELKGEDGSTGQQLRKIITTSNRAQMEAVRSEIERCLAENTIWKNHILNCLNEIEKEYPTSEVELSVFNPATGVFTVYLAASREDGNRYVPYYYLMVRDPEPVKMYFGCLESNGQAHTFYEILDKYYGGALNALLYTMTWGGKEFRDVDIAEDLGCIYRSYRCDYFEEEQKFFKFRDDRWRPCGNVNPIEQYYEYLGKNKKLVQQIVGKISPRDHQGGMDGSSAVHILDEIADIRTGEERKQFYVNPPEECDLCRCELAKQKYMVDGRLKNYFTWANMCADCAVYRGEGIGWGTGQLYLNKGGKWLMVGGFPDDAADAWEIEE